MLLKIQNGKNLYLFK